MLTKRRFHTHKKKCRRQKAVAFDSRTTPFLDSFLKSTLSNTDNDRVTYLLSVCDLCGCRGVNGIKGRECKTDARAGEEQDATCLSILEGAAGQVFWGIM